MESRNLWRITLGEFTDEEFFSLGPRNQLGVSLEDEGRFASVAGKVLGLPPLDTGYEHYKEFLGDVVREIVSRDGSYVTRHIDKHDKHYGTVLDSAPLLGNLCHLSATHKVTDGVRREKRLELLSGIIEREGRKFYNPWMKVRDAVYFYHHGSSNESHLGLSEEKKLKWLDKSGLTEEDYRIMVERAWTTSEVFDKLWDESADLSRKRYLKDPLGEATPVLVAALGLRIEIPKLTIDALPKYGDAREVVERAIKEGMSSEICLTTGEAGVVAIRQYNKGMGVTVLRRD